MRVYTNLNTLKKVKHLLKQLDLGHLLDGGEPNPNTTVSGILDKLLDEGLMEEFMQTITRDNQTDFAEMELVEMKEVISNFLSGIIEFLPESAQKILIPEASQEPSER